MNTGMTSSRYLCTIPSRTVSLESFCVHYLEAGVGHPLILVHGGGMWLYSFRHNIADLSRHFRVYALDMPGYGYTVPLREPLSMGLDTMSETLLQFMDRLGIGSATIAGHSWGGGWALHFTSVHPERVRGLVLMDSSGLAIRDVLEWELLKIPVVGSLLLKYITVRAVAKRLERSYHRPGMVTFDMALEVYLPLKLRHNRKAQIRLSAHQDWRSTEGALAGISQPVLLIWGDHDRYLDVGLLPRFQSGLAHAKTHVLKECGHSPHEEYPREVNRLITSFISEDVLGT